MIHPASVRHLRLRRELAWSAHEQSFDAKQWAMDLDATLAHAIHLLEREAREQEPVVLPAKRPQAGRAATHRLSPVRGMSPVPADELNAQRELYGERSGNVVPFRPRNDGGAA